MNGIAAALHRGAEGILTPSPETAKMLQPVRAEI